MGMADVTLVLDNEDRLLPVDFGEVELGRRLFRSGENEYLLNRQRLRLRDLVDLLDEAQPRRQRVPVHRPGHGRPGARAAARGAAAAVRGGGRHPQARAAPARSGGRAGRGREANLERLRDLLDELRPQARRLAAQAEQQRERRSAGAELAAALVAAARARLGGAARELSAGEAGLERARTDADAALERLRAAETASTDAAQALASRQEAERAQRSTLDGVRSRVVELRLAKSRAAGDAEGWGRDLARAANEREALHERMTAARLELAVALPESDLAAEGALEEATARLADAERQLGDARDASRAAAERTERAHEARVAVEAGLVRARTRATAAARALATQSVEADSTSVRATEAAGHAETVASESDALATAETEAEGALADARERLAAADERLARPTAALARARAEADAARAHLDALTRRLDAGGQARLPEPIRGGRRLDEGLEVEPRLRAAVAAVLGDTLTATSVPAGADDALAPRAPRGRSWSKGVPGPPVALRM